MACVSDLKATLQNRDEQIQELVSTVQASKDQATSAMEECTELREELEKKHVEVQVKKYVFLPRRSVYECKIILFAWKLFK